MYHIHSMAISCCLAKWHVITLDYVCFDVIDLILLPFCAKVMRNRWWRFIGPCKRIAASGVD